MACFCQDGTQAQILVQRLIPTTRQNEENCTTLHILPNISQIDATYIIIPISIIHECTSNCKYVQGATYLAERQSITTEKKLTLEHDYSNHLFCLLNEYALN